MARRRPARRRLFLRLFLRLCLLIWLLPLSRGNSAGEKKDLGVNRTLGGSVAKLPS